MTTERRPIFVHLHLIGAIIGLLFGFSASALPDNFQLVDGKSYYQILEVGQTADADEIKRAYRAKAKELHPDHGSGDEEQLKVVNNAYDVLKDPQKRAAYDRWLSSQGRSRTGSGPQSNGNSGYSGNERWRYERARRAYEDEQRWWRESQQQQEDENRQRVQEAIRETVFEIDQDLRQRMNYRNVYLTQLITPAVGIINEHLGYLYQRDRDEYYYAMYRLFMNYTLQPNDYRNADAMATMGGAILRLLEGASRQNDGWGPGAARLRDRLIQSLKSVLDQTGSRQHDKVWKLFYGHSYFAPATCGHNLSQGTVMMTMRDPWGREYQVPVHINISIKFGH